MLVRDTALGKASANAAHAQDLVGEINDDFKPKGCFSRVCFSPVRDLALLNVAEDLIRNAKSCVFISAPFAMDPQLVQAVKTNKKAVLEYGLSNASAKSKLAGLQDGHTRFLVPSVLKTFMGKEWDAKAFGQHKIHAKVIIADPWSTNPRVLFGSSNHSDESCKKNDENNVLIEGDARVAAILTTEFMRMFDHYNPRSFINEIKAGKQKRGEYLKPDSSWSATAFRATARSHKFRDRVVFSGED
ncbi:MAG: phospholipase D-like domain-containing protein [Burkholderiales bacterium]